MKSSDWQRIRSIYHSAVERPAHERSGFLQAACDGDSDLCARLESLLELGERTDQFLEPPSSAGVGNWPTVPRADVPAGTRIGGYAIRGVLGRGGMSVVYEAEQAQPQRLVALKVLRASPFLDDLTSRLFQREGQALARLEHPGIATIYEAGAEDGWYYFAMECVYGVPLTQYARDHGLSIPQRLQLFHKVCDGVHYAHQRGVIHRDLKPSNILVTESGQPKILDFGLARITAPDAELSIDATEPGAIRGTPAYMSPEQARGKADETDTRSDVYSLGVILYELLTDRPPYDIAGAPLPEAARIICEQPPRTPGSISRTLRGDLDTIVLKALQKDPEQRYVSAVALGENVDRYLNNHPILARPPSIGYQLRKFAARYRAPVALAVSLVVAVIIFAVVAGVQAVRLARERDAVLAAQRHEIAARESAEQVASFLENLFAHGDPELAEPNERTVRDLIEAGVSRLDTELAGQPLVRARLMNVLGSVYTKLGEFDRSRELLESAAEIRRREHGPDHPDYVETLRTLANTLTVAGEHERARELRADVLAIRQRSLTAPHPLIAEALGDLGDAQFYAADYAAAADRFRRALEMRRELYGSEHLEIVQSLSSLGLTLRSLGELKHAEDLLRESLEMCRRLLGDDEELAQVYENLAHVVRARGDLAEAERLLGEEVELLKRCLRADHPRIAWALNNYAVLVRQNRGSEQAEPFHRRALAIHRAAYGDDHPEVAGTLRYLGAVRRDLGDYEEGEKLLRDSLRICRAHFPDDHDSIAHSARALARLYKQTGRRGEAETLLLDSYAIFSANHGKHHPFATSTGRLLAELYDDWDKPEQAAEWRAKLPTTQPADEPAAQAAEQGNP